MRVKDMLARDVDELSGNTDSRNAWAIARCLVFDESHTYMKCMDMPKFNPTP